MVNKGCLLLQKYELGRLLGQGTFAKVYYARNVSTNQSVAIKMIDKEKVLKAGLMDQIKREISIMKLVKHPNIVQFYEVMATKTKIYFVMEYVKGGELFSKIARGRLEEDVARKYFQQLISAVEFCHSKGVYHRDLKPENLLLDESGNLKLSDFGLSALTESARQDGLLHTTCGTPAYVAPEVIGRKGYDGAKADTWSCGVILYVLLAAYLPFHDSNLMEMYRKIEKAEFRCPNWFPSKARKLLAKMLDPNPSTRISIDKILSNSWFKKEFNGNQIVADSESKEISPSDHNSTFSSSGSNSQAEQKPDVMKLKTMNAFDIICLSDGFDLSGLFVDRDHRKEARFTSWQPAAAIISKLEEVAKRLRFKVQKKDGGFMKMEVKKRGRKGVLAIDAEIFEITPSFHMVEMKMTNGDTLEFEKLCNENIRPALKGMVWSWLGEMGNLRQLQT
ncbi:CBL-interacting protein kinase 18-like [Phalaenopsis equestris]|uniref:CBL-interacting protein kinase 18-like n=1 Tax=Phalaenopsis equestris TaxID=78828 RepID=UPI0009E3017A|nr:CBL-interacting protein kinase 18-like [Phalaenopsis equestris]